MAQLGRAGGTVRQGRWPSCAGVVAYLGMTGSALGMSDRTFRQDWWRSFGRISCSVRQHCWNIRQDWWRKIIGPTASSILRIIHQALDN